MVVCGRRWREGEEMIPKCLAHIEVLFTVNSSLNLPVSSLTVVQYNQLYIK